MMICEKCEKELSTSVGACPACGHNSVLERIEVWRERRTQKLSSFTSGQAEEIKVPLRSARTNAKDATLIRFPQRTPAAPVAPPPPPSEPVPAWKERLNVRLQEIREQREPARTTPRPEEKFDRNPIIINALNRINRANYLQPITPVPHSRSAAAAELVPLPVETTPPPTAPREVPAPQIISRSTSVSFAPATLPYEPVVEMVAPAVEAEEDLLSEIHIDPVTTVTPIPQTNAETSAASASSLEAASLGKRVAAAVIDAEIIASSLLPLFGAYFFLSGWFEATTIYVPILVAVVLITVYFLVTYALAGRTMGMAWCNLHLASLSPSPEARNSASLSTVTFTLNQAIMRALGGTISLLLFPLNVLVIARSDDRLSISDYLSQTQVVRIRK